MYDIYSTFLKGTDNELEDWQKLLGGRIKGNTLYASEGTIKEYKFDAHKIIDIHNTRPTQK